MSVVPSDDGGSAAERVNARWAGRLLVVSYSILVAIVVVGAYWIQREFGQAQRERCQILQIQIQLMAVQSLLIEAQNRGQLNPPDQATQLLAKAQETMAVVCPAEDGDEG